MAKQHEAQIESPPELPDSTALLKELVTQLLARQPADPANMGLTEEQRQKLTAPIPLQKYRRIACKSEETGATFVANVVEARDKAKFPEGRITQIEEYRHPANLYKYVSAGGLIPDGMPVVAGKQGLPNLGANGEPLDELHPQFKDWRWQEFWKRDLRYFIGRQMRREFCAEDGGMQTPWLTSSNVPAEE